MAKKGVFLLLAVLTILLSFLNFVSASTGISTCQILTNGSYIFTSDINDTGYFNPCLFIVQNNTEIDCDGYRIWGVDANTTSMAIAVGTGGNPIRNITIKNCNIGNDNKTEFIYSISGQKVEDSIFYNINATRETFVLGNGGKNITLANSSIGAIRIYDTIENINIKNNLINCSYDFSECNHKNYLRGSGINFINNEIITIGYDWGMIWDYSASIPIRTKMIGNKITCLSSTAEGCVDLYGAGYTEFANNIITAPNYPLVSMPIFAYYYLSSFSGYDNILNATSDTLRSQVGSDSASGFLLNTTGIIDWFPDPIFIKGIDLRIKWYVRVKVEDIEGNDVQDALITAYTDDGNWEYSGYTKSDGTIDMNLSQYAITNSIGTILPLTPNSINATKYGYINGTSFNLTGNIFNITIILPFNQSNITLPPVNNSLPSIISLNLSQIYCCVKPDIPLIIETLATDPENDTIQYAYKCSDGEVLSNFTTNNTAICTYSSLGERNFTIAIRDVIHPSIYLIFTKYILVTTRDCVMGSSDNSICLDLKIVDIDNENEGILPQIYFGTLAVLVTMSKPAIVFGITVLATLFIIFVARLFARIINS
jgi:hypothetical protein